MTYLKRNLLIEISIRDSWTILGLSPLDYTTIFFRAL
jgi:hypothetical protein